MPKLSDLLPGILSGATGEFTRRQDEKRAQRQKLEQILLAAQASQQAKRLYPSPEEEAKAQFFKYLLGQTGSPAASASPAAPPQFDLGSAPSPSASATPSVAPRVTPGQLAGAPAGTLGAAPPSSAAQRDPKLRILGAMAGVDMDKLFPGDSTKLAEKGQEDVQKRQLETSEGFQKAMGLFSSLVAQFKSKIQQQGGEGGILPGLGGKVRSALKKPGAEAIAAYVGQRKETAFALNRIITGQNRVIESVIEHILDTLPDEFDTPEFAAQKIAQSITNSYRLARAVNTLQLTPAQLDGLQPRQIAALAQQTAFSPEDEQFVEGLIQQVLGTPAAELQTFPAEESDPFLQQIQQQIPGATVRRKR